MSRSDGSVPLFTVGAWRCDALAPGDVPRVQDFYDANPEYFLAVMGEGPKPDAARRSFDGKPPDGWPFDGKWLLGFADATGTLVAFADVIANLFVPGVWHVGFFVVGTELHGTGAAKTLCEGLEEWMRKEGAAWSRLGVVIGNARAERFWERMGYIEVRKRCGVEMGLRVNDLRVMVKPLEGGALADYLALVERDREDS